VFHASIWGGLELSLGGLSPPKLPHGDGTGQGGAITRAPNHSVGAEWLRRRLKIPTMSHVHSSIQYIASGRPQVRKWGRQTCIFPRGPSNLVTPLSIWRL